MSNLVTGLYVPGSQGIRTGLAVGLNSYYGPAELFTMDWTPSLGNDLDDPNYPATYLWALDESSGATTLVESRVGGGTHDLVASGGSTNHFVGQAATGITDGADLSSRKCVEMVTGGVAGDRFESGSSCLDCSVGSVAVRVRLRGPHIPTLGNHSIIGTTNGGAGPGWELRWIGGGSNSKIRGAVYDGTTVALIDCVGGQADGAWHEIEFIVDWTAGEIRIRVDASAATPVSLSSLVQANTSGIGFSVGNSMNRAPFPGTQIERVLGWEAGDGAESIDATAWADVSKLGAAPAGINSTYDTLPSYSGAASVPCDAGNDGLWYLASGDKTTDDYPIGYSSLLETRGAPNGFGRAWHGTHTNLITRSEQLENAAWSTGTATVSAAAADLIDNKLGFRMARKVTATTTNDFIGFPVTLSANGDYHIYAYIAGNGGTVSGRLILYDVTGTAEVNSVAFSVGDGVLELVGKEMVMSANTSAEVRIEIDTDTEAINVCHVTCVKDTSIDTADFIHSGLPIPTFGATATLPNLLDFAVMASADWNEAAGSLEYCVVQSGAAPFMSLFDMGPGGTATPDRLLIEPNDQSDEYIRVRQWDGAGTQKVTIGGAMDIRLGLRIRYEWDSVSPVGGAGGNHARLRVAHSSGSVDNTDAASGWTAGNNITRHAVGYQVGTSGRWSAGLAGYIKVWRGPGAFD